MNNFETYHLITRILSLVISPNRIDEIINSFPKTKKEWQKWVYIGSKNLVLQSLFITLKENKLLIHLPHDLADDLEYFHRLNVERNTKILQQVKALQQILGNKGIGFVLMKGTANIFDGLYRDIGERMVYDIDILVEDTNMLKAAQLLHNAGYNTQKKFNPLAYPSTMHYPVLVSEDYPAGVEIHRIAVQYHYLKSFGSGQIFETQRPSSSDPSIWVMSDENKLIHNFMHSQLMHKGYYHADISVRDLYDFLLISNRVDKSKVLERFGFYKRQSNAYINLTDNLFGLAGERSNRNGIASRCLALRHSFFLSLNHKQQKVYLFIAWGLIKYLALPFKTLFDRNARNYVFSRLRNKYWYKEHLNAYRRKFKRNKN